MRPDIDYQNHKNRLTSFHQEAQAHRLARMSDKKSGITLLIKNAIQKLTGWVAQFKTWRAAKTEQPLVQEALSQHESIA